MTNIIKLPKSKLISFNNEKYNVVTVQGAQSLASAVGGSLRDAKKVLNTASPYILALASTLGDCNIAPLNNLYAALGGRTSKDAQTSDQKALIAFQQKCLYGVKFDGEKGRFTFTATGKEAVKKRKLSKSFSFSTGFLDMALKAVKTEDASTYKAKASVKGVESLKDKLLAEFSQLQDTELLTAEEKKIQHDALVASVVNLALVIAKQELKDALAPATKPEAVADSRIDPDLTLAEAAAEAVKVATPAKVANA